MGGFIRIVVLVEALVQAAFEFGNRYVEALERLLCGVAATITKFGTLIFEHLLRPVAVVTLLAEVAVVIAPVQFFGWCSAVGGRIATDKSPCGTYYWIVALRSTWIGCIFASKCWR